MEAQRMWPVVSNSQSGLETRRGSGMSFIVNNNPIPRRGRAVIVKRKTAKTSGLRVAVAGMAPVAFASTSSSRGGEPRRLASTAGVRGGFQQLIGPGHDGTDVKCGSQFLAAIDPGFPSSFPHIREMQVRDAIGIPARI